MAVHAEGGLGKASNFKGTSAYRRNAVLFRSPEQKTSSQGVPASSAARIVGAHSMSRPVARRRSSASRRAARQPSARRSWRIRAIGVLRG
jgi:hypothetical protein